MNPLPKPQARIASLDQFRGFTIAAMYFVNLYGARPALPAVFTHHGTFCSLADLVMPQFFFAVGFASRLSFFRRMQQGEGQRTAMLRAVRRCFALIAVGVVYYRLDGNYPTWNDLCNAGITGVLKECLRHTTWQTLVHIALASLWILPVIASKTSARVAFMLGTGGLHLLLSWLFFYDFADKAEVVDGGPLGFMSWAIPMLAGTLAYDWVIEKEPRGALKPVVLWGLALMLLGYGMSCLNAIHQAALGGEGATGWAAWFAAPPFFKPWVPRDLWTMSQMTGSVSYMTFSAGAALAVYAVFLWIADVKKIEWGAFRALGVNALVAYLLEDYFSAFLEPFVPQDAPAWYLLCAFTLCFAMLWSCMRYLENRKLFLRL